MTKFILPIFWINNLRIWYGHFWQIHSCILALLFVRNVSDLNSCGKLSNCSIPKRKKRLSAIPVDTGRKLNVFMYVQFTSCVYGDRKQIWHSQIQIFSFHHKLKWHELINLETSFSTFSSGYHYFITSFNKAWTQTLRRFKSCSRRVGDSRWWGSLTMVPAGNKAKRLLSVNYTTNTIQFTFKLINVCPQSF